MNEDMVRKSCLERIFKPIDYFGMEPHFLFNNSKKHRTTFGGIISLLVYILIILGFFSFGKELFLRQSPTVITSDQFIPEPERYNITPQNYNFYIGFQDVNALEYIIDPTLVNITAQFIIQIKLKDDQGNVYYNQTSKDLRLEVCNLQRHFSNYPQLFENEPLQDLLCVNPDDSKELYLTGSYGTQEFAFVSINLKACRNSSYSDVVCRSQQELDYRLSGGYFIIDNIDTMFNPQNFTNPASKIRRDLYTTYSTVLYKEWDLYYRNVDYTTDKGWLLEDSFTEPFLRYEGAVELSDFRDTTDGFFTCVIRMSFFKDFHQRTYLKLQQVIANIGGLIKGIILIVEALLFTYKSSNYYLALANQLYLFNSSQSTDELDNLKSYDKIHDTSKIINTINPPVVYSKIKADFFANKKYVDNLKKSTSTLPNVTNNAALNLNKVNSLGKEINNKLTKLKIRPKSCNYFNLYFPFCKTSNPKLLFINHVIKAMERKNNIENLLNLYEEFSLFKRVSLNETQTKLFDFNSGIKFYKKDEDKLNALGLCTLPKIDANNLMLLNDDLTKNLINQIDLKYDYINGIK